jgi:carbonic anhydrase
MSCPTATAPIDINLSKVSGKCDFKCKYSFKYNNSACVATNRGDYISLSYDKSSSPPVIYNSVGYDVQEVRIYSPSLHSYSGAKTDAELVIVHMSNSGSIPLLVCIPIKINNSMSTSAQLFSSIIETVSNNAPADGETTTVNTDNYNLSDLVPRKPYFSYTATEPYQPCSTTVDYVVFAPLNASLDITQETLDLFRTFMIDNPYDVKTGTKFFYNEKGSEVSMGNGEIYIDCQPVGSSEETVNVVKNKESYHDLSFNDYLKNPFVKVFLGSLLFILILYFIKYLLTFIKPQKGGSITSQVTGGSRFTFKY